MTPPDGTEAEGRAIAQGFIRQIAFDDPAFVWEDRLTSKIDAALRARTAEWDEAQRKYGLASRLVTRLPLCQDHRDKFDPEHCQACRAERAEQERDRLAERVRAVEEALGAMFNHPAFRPHRDGYIDLADDELTPDAIDWRDVLLAARTALQAGARIRSDS